MSKYLNTVVTLLLATGAHTAMKYVSEKEVVRVTRVLSRGRLPRKGSNIDLRIQIGRPNFLERRFIKACVKAGEKFPVKKIQLKFPAKKRK